MESHPRQSPMHSDTGEYVQQQYNEPSTSSEALRRSNRDVHTEVKPYKCGQCDKMFVYKSQFLSHKRTHTGEKPYTCEFCDRSYSKKQTLTRHHLSIHFNTRLFECDECKKKFSTKEYLRNHIIRKHMEQKPYKCDHCEKQFADRRLLIRHTKIHTDEKCVCEICNETCSNKFNLKIHKYIHNDKKPFQCSICDKGYIRKISVLRHMKRQGDAEGTVMKNPACLEKIHATDKDIDRMQL